ncbi:hypothetical protein [Streptomyces sp. Root1295]|uniref:hypothetical protein n=1 Tax=Streptomyces TaxID=1883 RepID=UPI00322069AC
MRLKAHLGFISRNFCSFGEDRGFRLAVMTMKTRDRSLWLQQVRVVLACIDVSGIRPIKPPLGHEAGGTQAEERMTLPVAGVPRAARSPVGTGPVALLKSMVPPENAASLKSTVPLEKTAGLKFTVPPENTASLKSTVPPENLARPVIPDSPNNTVPPENAAR